MTDKLITMDAIKYLKHSILVSKNETVVVNKRMLQLAIDEFEDEQLRSDSWKRAYDALQNARTEINEEGRQLIKLQQKYGRDVMDIVESLIEALEEKYESKS